jgi:Uma2 family endonuclease
MVAQPKPLTFTVAEYLAMEEVGDTKHEYLDGYIYAMAGGTPDHAQLGGNIITALNNALRRSPCRVYDSDVRLELTPTQYVYPDVAVSCDERDRASAREKYIHYPSLIVEVTSDTTEGNDRGEKLLAYGATETIMDYLIVNHRRRLIEHYERQAADVWMYRHYYPGSVIPIHHLDIQLDVDDIYLKIDL